LEALDDVNVLKGKFDIAFNYRDLFAKNVDAMIQKAIASNNFDASMVVKTGGDSNKPLEFIRPILIDCTTALFKRAYIPNGIAPTEALCFNLFAIVTCIDAKIPLTILGPAGCSKTLSYVLAEENMKVGSVVTLSLQLQTD